MKHLVLNSFGLFLGLKSQRIVVYQNKEIIKEIALKSLLASKHFNKPFSKIMLICGNNLKFKIFNVKSDDLAQFDNIIGKIDKMLNQEQFRQSCASIAVCMQCEFKNYCDDRE